MIKIIFFDTETTGLDSKIHGMHQLAGDIIIDHQLVDRFDYRINPFKECEIDKEALKISNTSCLDFMRYNKEFQVQYMLNELATKHLNYADKTDKFFLAGWRAPEFDVKFLQAFFNRNSSKEVYDSYFWSNPIDVKSLASQYLINERHKIVSFSLAPIARYLGVEVDESQLHKGSYDAYLCRKVYEIVTDTRIVDKKILRKIKR